MLQLTLLLMYKEVHVTAEADQDEVKFDPAVLFAAEYLQATETNM